jgi:eukaryotic-like serine/threonine-protein kinase
VERIVQEALDLPRAQRAAYVALAGAGNETRRESVEALLAHRESTLAAAGRAYPDSGLTGSQIGAYTVGPLIGVGGMGVVYLAEQERPFRRQIALKIIKLGMRRAKSLRGSRRSVRRSLA